MQFMSANPGSAKPVESVEFWRDRVRHVRGAGRPYYAAVWDASEDSWIRTQMETAAILPAYLHSGIKLLDAGCGAGYLLDCLPHDVFVDYWGVDMSPDLIEIAKWLYSARADRFLIGNFRNLPFDSAAFDLVVVRAVRGMFIQNVGRDAWACVLPELHRVGNQVLFIENCRDEHTDSISYALSPGPNAEPEFRFASGGAT